MRLLNYSFHRAILLSTLLLLAYCAIPNCLQSNIDSTCKKCDSNYSLSQTSLTCVSTIPHCRVYTDTQQCSKCTPTYTLTPSKLTCAIQIIYCQLYNQDQTCKQCIKGYVLQNNICFQNKFSNCQIYDMDGSCGKYYQNVIKINIDNQIPYVPKCQSYNLNGTCKQCLFGYDLYNNNCYIHIQNCLAYSSSGACQQYQSDTQIKSTDPISTLIIDNCVTYSQDRSKCLFCASDYILDWEGSWCYVKIQNCRQYSFIPEARCSKCQVGYLLLANDRCVKQIANCIAYGSNNECVLFKQQIEPNKIIQNCFIYDILSDNQRQCLKCDIGYQMVNKNCFKQIQNCLSYFPNGQCEQYQQQSKSISQQKIMLEIENCQKYDWNRKSCLACKSGFLLKQNICYNNSQPKCSSYNYNNQCTMCQHGYTLFKGICYSTIQKCLSYFTNGTCQRFQTQIEQGEFEDSQKQKVQQKFVEIPDCQKYSWDNKTCQVCKSGYMLKQNVCWNRSQLHCRNYNFQNQCTECQNGFILYKGSCHQTIQKCLVYFSNGTCQVQQTPIKQAQFKITQKKQNSQQNFLIPHCQKYSWNRKQCLTCQNGFILKQNQCYNKSQQKCSSYDYLNQCTSCQHGYTLYKGLCHLTVQKCLVYFTNGTCEIFQKQIKQAQFKEVTKQEIQQNPEKLIGNCQKYSWDRKQCLNCENGFFLKQNLCYNKTQQKCLAYNYQNDCLSCEIGYTLFKLRCYLTVQNCILYFTNGSCQKYEQKIEQAQLRVIVQNCASFNEKKQCTACYKGFIIITQNSKPICIQQIQHCLQYNPTNQQCVKCSNGMTLSNNKCHPTIQNCTTYYSNGSCSSFNKAIQQKQGIENCVLYKIGGQCLSCEDGFQLFNKKCIQKIFACTVYDFTTQTNGLCLKCENGYLLIKNRCYLKIQNCQEYSSVDQCSLCYGGYELSNNICYLQVKNCFEYLIDGQCKVCDKGYELNPTNGICYQEITGCFSYDFDGSCNQCEGSLVLIEKMFCLTPVKNCVQYNTLSVFKEFRSLSGLAAYECVKCASTPVKYTLINNLCAYVENCFLYDKLGQCIQCKDQYYLFKNKCLSKQKCVVNKVVSTSCSSSPMGCIYTTSNKIQNC